MLKSLIKQNSNFHSLSASEPNIFIFTMPRSGSTWLMELLVRQPKFKYVSEPFNIRNELVRKYLKINSWEELYSDKNEGLIQDYIEGLSSGKLGFLNPNPFGDYYKMFTNRIVFKIIHFGEHRINWFKEEFGGKVVFLFRHPIAVTHSRKVLPRIETLVEGDYSKNFTPSQLKYAKEVVKGGNHFQKGIVSWCLQNALPIRDRQEDWAFISYEQLVSDPEVVANHLKEKLNLVNVEKILENIDKFSMVKSLSDATTHEIMKKGKRDKLLTKWKDKTSKEQEEFTWKTLEVFGLDIYQKGNFMPNSKYLIKP